MNGRKDIRGLRRWIGIVAAFCATSALPASALGPHELLLLVNRDSPRSVELARHYAQRRGIPPCNVVYLALPEKVMAPAASVSLAEFRKHIWEPAISAVAGRGLQDHILAWAYSLDFPVLVTTDPPMSLQGVTFLRGDTSPGKEVVTQALYRSPLFAGPEPERAASAPSRTLSPRPPWLEVEPAVPSMMLAFMGSRGNEWAAVMRHLDQGAKADATQPDGEIFFIQRADIRSRCRDWQFSGARDELSRLGVQATIVKDKIPGGTDGIVGVMDGAAWASPFFGANAYRPGCMAEHLTSAAAIFKLYDQTKLTSWLHAGVTGSAGAVTEPLALWQKFPHAWFFVHYARGCTMLESFFQSIACPLQVLLVGDPLASPWAAKMEVRVVAEDDQAAPGGVLSFRAKVEPASLLSSTDYMFLLDGVTCRPRSSEATIRLDPGKLEDGYHVLRVVAYARDAVSRQAFADHGFLITNRGREIQFTVSGVGRARDPWVSVVAEATLPGEGTDEPSVVRLLEGPRELDQKAWADGGTWHLDARQIGAGPVALQAVAEFPDGARVRSPIKIAHLDRRGPKPELEEVRIEEEGEGLRLSASVRLAEGATSSLAWVQRLPWPADEANGEPLDSFMSDISLEDHNLRVKAQNDVAPATFRHIVPRNLKEVGASLFIPGHLLQRQVAGLVFNYKSPDDFDFFGAFGDHSAWVLGRYRKGVVERAVSRGAFIRQNAWHRISLRRSDDAGVEGWINGEPVCRSARMELGPGRVGILAGPEEVQFKEYYVSPPQHPEGVYSEAEGELVVSDTSSATAAELQVLARRGSAEVRMTVVLPDAVAP